jgi:hypothetical protein
LGLCQGVWQSLHPRHRSYRHRDSFDAFEINIPAGPTSFLPELPSQHQGLPRRHADLLGPYCETDRLSVIPWKLFEQTLMGWSRVQAILEFRPQPISFDYMKADRSRAHGGSSVSSC